MPAGLSDSSTRSKSSFISGSGKSTKPAAASDRATHNSKSFSRERSKYPTHRANSLVQRSFHDATREPNLDTQNATSGRATRAIQRIIPMSFWFRCSGFVGTASGIGTSRNGFKIGAPASAILTARALPFPPFGAPRGLSGSDAIGVFTRGHVGSRPPARSSH